MAKLLEKTLKDAIKERKRHLGIKQVLTSVKDSKLIVLSQSVPEGTVKEIQEKSTKAKVSTVNFKGTSIALGKLCGLQFRVSAISLPSVSDANIKAILKETKRK